jgi:hypothetical protein
MLNMWLSKPIGAGMTKECTPPYFGATFSAFSSTAAGAQDTSNRETTIQPLTTPQTMLLFIASPPYLNAEFR